MSTGSRLAWGMSPAAASQSRTPNAKTSTASVYRFFSKSSRAMYGAVPAHCIVPEQSSDLKRAKPKSQSFVGGRGPLPQRRTLWLFTSRWTTSVECMYASADAACVNTWGRVWLLRPELDPSCGGPWSISKSDPPSMYSVRKLRAGGTRQTAISVTMFGCRSRRNMRTSFSKSALSSFVMTGSKIFLRAHGVQRHWAWCTDAKPPCAIWGPTWTSSNLKVGRPSSSLENSSASFRRCVSLAISC
mmetsp:Transcript_77244/g.174742  ORF Transcript_77244/g.174742 Transcript_77244/m.174742 type:complete len:244 (+) Transcript_77244:212-943(+)